MLMFLPCTASSLALILVLNLLFYLLIYVTKCNNLVWN
ncbi:hypothetical protein BVRB_4g079520 [Beta vulgaris subsp. vulgaris]|nr:hypothetical protein BVRB_4g079520 [Beta vulgaris subsp. vulgaris]